MAANRLEIVSLDEARSHLDLLWTRVQRDSSTVCLPAAITEAIRRSVNSQTKTYRYVLPAQLLAKSVNPNVDCRSIQASCGLPGAFDARTFCHGVIVPFDRSNDNVLGGSTEPYANNPLRIPAVIRAERAAQKNKTGFDDLILVLEHAQNHPDDVRILLEATFQAVLVRLSTVRIIYPVPNRMSLLQCQEMLLSFLATRTGGTRLQAISVALFKTIGERFGLFELVTASNVNAADQSTSSAADLECKDKTGRVVLAVEVKDRRLTLRHVQDKLPAVREKGISEFIFLVQGGVESKDADAVASLGKSEFAVGQNLYVCEFQDFLRTCLVLFGDRGRRVFLLRVGEELDAHADLRHRQQWRDLLKAI